MNAIMLLVLASAYVALPACALVAWTSRSGESLLACTALFLLFADHQARRRYCLLKAMIRGRARAACTFFSSSNHFTLSPAIISLFSALLLILYHTLKIPEFLPAS